MEVSARLSATLPGRPLCVGGVYGRSSPVSLCSLRGSVSWCPGLGRLLASAALLCAAPGPGTDFQRPFDHQNSRSLHSSASSRPTRLFPTPTGSPSLDPSVPALDSAGCSCECRVPSSHRRCCDCIASSAPTTNVQSRLDCKLR